jgi:hypothetical protein
VFPLASKSVIASFPPDFFGSPYSGSWTLPIQLPNVRIAAAEFYVTNKLGNSETTGISLTHTTDAGLRTLSGGQYSIQVDGFLAVDQSAAPVLVVEAPHAVRDIYAVLGKAADSTLQLQINVNSNPYCTLTFLPGMTVSSSVEGVTLPPLSASDQITLSVVSVGQTYPGSDLTVVIRL